MGVVIVRALQPMNIWDMLDRSVRLYRRHVWRLLVGAVLVSLAGYTVNRLVLFGIQAHAKHVPFPGASLGQALVLTLLSLSAAAVALVVGFAETGILSVLVSDAYIADRVSLPEALARLPISAVLGACLLSGLIIGVGFMMCVVPGLFFAVTFALVPVVSALERCGSFASLKRSWGLVRAPMPRGFWNNTVTRIIIIWTFVAALSLLALVVLGAVTEMVPDSWRVERSIPTPMGRWQLRPLRPWIGVGMDLFGVVVQAFFRPFFLCALVLLYYDIRARKEGLDIELLLQRPDGRQGGQPQPGAVVQA